MILDPDKALADVTVLWSKAGVMREDEFTKLSEADRLFHCLNQARKLVTDVEVHNEIPRKDSSSDLHYSYFKGKPAARCVNCGEWLTLYVDDSYMGRVFWTHAETRSNKQRGAYVKNECPPRYAKAK